MKKLTEDQFYIIVMVILLAMIIAGLTYVSGKLWLGIVLAIAGIVCAGLFQLLLEWLKNKLSQDGLTLQHEWYFTYTPSGARMGKHCDVLGTTNLRYSFAVRQPMTDRSITIDDIHYYIPQNTAYILDGRMPHEIMQDADSPRIMLLGALSVGSLD